MEEKLTLTELFVIAEAMADQKHENLKFQAALQGIDLDNNSSNGGVEMVDIRDAVKTLQHGDDAVAFDFGLGYEEG